MVAKLVLFVTENDEKRRQSRWLAIVYFPLLCGMQDATVQTSNVQIGRFSAPTNKKI
jgi:hypothetical protein